MTKVEPWYKDHLWVWAKRLFVCQALADQPTASLFIHFILECYILIQNQIKKFSFKMVNSNNRVKNLMCKWPITNTYNTLQARYEVRTNPKPIFSVQCRNNPERTLNQSWSNFICGYGTCFVVRTCDGLYHFIFAIDRVGTLIQIGSQPIVWTLVRHTVRRCLIFPALKVMWSGLDQTIANKIDSFQFLPTGLLRHM